MKSATFFRFNRFHQTIAILAIAGMAVSSPAANLTWDANPTQAGAQDGSGVWDTATSSWWTGAANTTWNSATPDVAFFGTNSGAAGTVTLGADVVSGNIIFNAPSAGNYTIAGGGFALGLTNRSVLAGVNASISANIVGGNVVISHGPQQGPSGLITLGGNNSFTGGVTIGENANNPNGVPAPNTTAAVRINSSTALGTGTLNFNGQGNATSPRLELTSGITVTNTINFQGRNNVAVGIESFSGANTLAGPLNPNPGGSQYPIRVDGASTLTLGGTLTVQNSGPRAIVLGGTGTGANTGSIVGGSATVPTIVVNKAGPGSWTFSGANTYSGTYILSEGTLNLDYATQNNAKLSAVTPLYLAGGTLNLSGGSFVETVSSNNLTAGSGTISRSSGTSTLRLNAINRREGGTLNLAAGGLADTDTLNVNGILGGYATVAGADWAINSTSAADAPITAYTGYTDINALGSTIANSATANVRLNAAGAGGNITVGALTTTINTLLQNTATAATVDTSVGTLRLGATGGVLIPAGRQSLTIGVSAGSGSLTAGGADDTPGEVILINNSANNLTVNSTITDNGAGVVALTKSGSGAATLNGFNTHSGTNYIVGGTLNVNNAASLSSGAVVVNGGTLRATANVDLGNPVLVGPSAGYGNGTIDVASGQILNLFGVVSDNSPFLSGVSLAGSLTKTGPGTLALWGANTHTLGTIINGGTLSISADNNLGGFTSPSLNGTFTCYQPDNVVINGGTLEINGSFTLSANRGIRLGPINGSGIGTINVTDGQVVTFNGQISDNWAGSGSLVKAGNGTLLLGGAVNDYSGNTTVSAGTLQLGNIRAIPNGPGKGNLMLAGTLDLNNTSANLNGLSGAGAVDNLAFGEATLSVGYNDATSTFSGLIQNSGGGALSLTKAGSGTLTLSGALSVNANLRVAGGVLALTGSAAPSLATNITTVSGGTLNVSGLAGGLTVAAGQTLAGDGTVLGNLTSGSGAVIAPGASAGTLTVNGNLTLNGGALNYELSNVTTPGAGVNDLTIVTGTLNLAGSTTINLSYLAGAPGVGTYTLIQYGTLSGNVANLVPPPGFTINNNTTDKTIELILTHVPTTLMWKGDGAANVWDTGFTANWLEGGNSQFFYTGDTAMFDNTGFNTPAINIVGPVSPAAVVVNASLDYTFTGSPIVTGSLTKGGAGTLTLENDNSYAGFTTINGGTLQVGNFGFNGAIGTGPVTNNGALVYNRADTVTLGSAISGTGSFTQAGSGGTILTASNSFSGMTTVNTGVLTVRNASALGTTAAGTIVNPGGQLFVDQNVSFTNEALTLSGGGPGNGALRKGGGATTWTGPVTVVSDATIHLDGNAALNLIHANGITGTDTPLTLAGDGGGQGFILAPINIGAGTLTKNGGSAWTVSTNNVFTGKTFINGGTLFIPNATALGPVGGVTPDYVSLNGGSLGVTNDVAFTDGLRGFSANGAVGGFNVGAGATLTVANDISGAGFLTKSGAGTLLLNAAHSFAGTLNLDTASTTVSDGVVRLTTGAAVANVLPPIWVRNNNGGSSTLQLDGAGGPISIAQTFRVSCRNVDVPWIISLAGNNTLAGGVEFEVGGNRSIFQSDAGLLTISGDLSYVGTLTGARTYVFLGAGDHLVSGAINDSLNGAPISVAKGGPGTLTLSASNTYGTFTIISNGVLNLTGSITSTGGVSVVGGALAGTGSITDNVTVQSSLPSGSLDSLTINGDYTINGTLAVDVNRAGLLADFNTVSGALSAVTGGVTVNNLGADLQVADTFVLFNKPVPGGGALTVTGAGVTWNNNLAVNGTIQVAGVVPTTPTTITAAPSGNDLALSWPASHLGWVLQTQTNALTVGLDVNWVDVPDSASVTTVNIPINPANPTVFFRLRYP